MNYEESLEEIETILSELQEENKTIPIIVEGDKDKEALQKLDINGEIIVFNRGMSISMFCDQIAQKYTAVILLLDWDHRGGQLSSAITKQLKGRTTCNLIYRKHLAKRSMIRTVEGLPSFIETLKKKLDDTKNNTFTAHS